MTELLGSKIPAVLHTTPAAIRKVMCHADEVTVHIGALVIPGQIVRDDEVYVLVLVDPLPLVDSVEVRFFDGGYRYRAFCGVIEQTPRRLLLQRPIQVRQQDRRRFPRLSGEDWQISGACGPIELIDVSANGAALRVRSDCAQAGRRLQLEIARGGSMASPVTFLIHSSQSEGDSWVLRGTFLPADPEDEDVVVEDLQGFLSSVPELGDSNF